MLQLKANLLRKESAYEPRTCVVEKVIPMYGRSFEQFRQDLLEDNLCIHKYKDLMYIDPEDNAHCLLFVDQNSGDGILVESEGADYARYSQYIPNAQAIIQQSEQTQAEQKLHGLFRNISEQIANDLHNGKTSFCLQDYMEKTDLEELIRGSVRELLDKRADIQQVQDVSLDVPFQPDFQITAKHVQELKFYCPLTIRREPDYDEEYDYGEEYPEIPSSAAAGYADTVQKRLETYCSDDGKRGLMEYYDREKSVSEKVYSAVPSVITYPCKQ